MINTHTDEICGDTFELPSNRAKYCVKLLSVKISLKPKQV